MTPCETPAPGATAPPNVSGSDIHTTPRPAPAPNLVWPRPNTHHRSPDRNPSPPEIANVPVQPGCHDRHRDRHPLTLRQRAAQHEPYRVESASPPLSYKPRSHLANPATAYAHPTHRMALATRSTHGVMQSRQDSLTTRHLTTGTKRSARLTGAAPLPTTTRCGQDRLRRSHYSGTHREGFTPPAGAPLRTATRRRQGGAPPPDHGTIRPKSSAPVTAPQTTPPRHGDPHTRAPLDLGEADMFGGGGPAISVRTMGRWHLADLPKADPSSSSFILEVAEVWS
jgi:hypothetical protein